MGLIPRDILAARISQVKGVSQTASRVATETGSRRSAFPQNVFDDLVGRGVITADTNYPMGQLWCVPADFLGEFNTAIQFGSPNVFYP